MLAGSKVSPIWNATTVELFLVKKYLAPFLTSQFELSDNSLNPLLDKRVLHQSTTWKAEGEAFTNSRNLSARTLLLFNNYPYISFKNNIQNIIKIGTNNKEFFVLFIVIGFFILLIYFS